MMNLYPLKFSKKHNYDFALIESLYNQKQENHTCIGVLLEESIPNYLPGYDILVKDYKEKYIIYDYDFGDGWQIELEFLGIVEGLRKRKSFCLEGDGLDPMEDMGGIEFFNDIIKAVNNPKSKLGSELINNYKEICDYYIYNKFDISQIKYTSKSKIETLIQELKEIRIKNEH